MSNRMEYVGLRQSPKLDEMLVIVSSLLNLPYKIPPDVFMQGETIRCVNSQIDLMPKTTKNILDFRSGLEKLLNSDLIENFDFIITPLRESFYKILNDENPTLPNTFNPEQTLKSFTSLQHLSDNPIIMILGINDYVNIPITQGNYNKLIAKLGYPKTKTNRKVEDLTRKLNKKGYENIHAIDLYDRPGGQLDYKTAVHKIQAKLYENPQATVIAHSLGTVSLLNTINAEYFESEYLPNNIILLASPIHNQFIQTPRDKVGKGKSLFITSPHDLREKLNSIGRIALFYAEDDSIVQAGLNTYKSIAEQLLRNPTDLFLYSKSRKYGHFLKGFPDEIMNLFS